VSTLLEEWFPRLRVTGYEVTSQADEAYNCIAWAAGETDRWWWPDSLGSDYWPDNVPRIVSLAAFVQAYETVGYEVCEGDAWEAGFEKIAIYVNREGKPTHAARQLPDGSWTSKLGRAEDITHALDGLVGENYGAVTQMMRRPLPASS
jgi:hypothetical protein